MVQRVKFLNRVSGYYMGRSFDFIAMVSQKKLSRDYMSKLLFLDLI